jgi:hypothetical protein
MTRAGLAAGLALLAAGAALAKPGTPGPHYFQGTYERIGRTGGAGAMLLNDRVRIEPVGQSVTIRGCTGPEVLMGFGPAFEIVNLMTGAVGPVPVDCLFHNNGYNRPILTCAAADGGAFTLWPLADAPLDCG